MTSSSNTSALKELQTIDERVRVLRKEIQSFDPRLAEVEDPALRLEGELAKLKDRLATMETDARHLERSVVDKRARSAKLDERLNKVTNLREESAVRTELDIVKRAIEADAVELYQLQDGIRKAEITLEELETFAAEARAEVEPAQTALLEERSKLQAELDELTGRREGALVHLNARERRVYDAFHGAGRAVVVAQLTEDGACGNCFGMIPLQLQNEIRQGASLLQCEACGVILTADELDGETAEA